MAVGPGDEAADTLGATPPIYEGVGCQIEGRLRGGAHR